MIVVNTSPLLHLATAFGSLEPLPKLFGTVIVPHEVLEELKAGLHLDDTAQLALSTPGIHVNAGPLPIPAYLLQPPAR
jgi:predicted nucleic acid-binding protein